MIKNKRAKSIGVVSLVVSLLLIFNSCSFFNPEPELTVNNGIPSIKHIDNDKELNFHLNEYFSALNSYIEQANSEGYSFKPVYSLYAKSDKKDVTEYVLENKISNGNEYYPLDDVIIYSDGRCELPEMPSAEALCDGEFIESLIKLKSCAISADINSYDSYFGFADSLKMIIPAYEHIMGQPVDFSKIVDSSSDDEYFKKGLELGIITDYNDSYLCEDDYTYFSVNFNNDLNKLAEHIYKEKLGKYSGGVSLEEFSGILKDLLYKEGKSKGSPLIKKVNERWTNACDNLNFDFSEKESIENPSALTRGDMAVIFVSLYEHFCGTAEIYDDYYFGDLTEYDLPDTTMDAIKKALSMFLMDPMFGTDFEPLYSPNFTRAIDYASIFVGRLRTEYINNNCSDLLGDTDSTDILRCHYDLAVKKTKDFLNKFENAGQAGVNKKVVNNSREYNWYYTQNDGTQYSHVNCMPSITCMAIKWCNKYTTVTPDELRRLYPDITEGWFLFMVEECLDKYDVDYEEYDVDFDTIIGELDKGNIILAQINENTKYQSGHCMVIYGYEQIGNSFIFYIHDPDVREGKNQYDKFYGEDIRMEANYACHIIKRYSVTLLSVKGQKT